MSIFNEDEIVEEAYKKIICEFAEKHIVGFQKHSAYFEIRLKPDVCPNWYRASQYSDRVVIPSVVVNYKNGMLVTNIGKNKYSNMIIHDYDGDDIDWLDMDVKANNIILINCPNLRQYKGENFQARINKYDII